MKDSIGFYVNKYRTISNIRRKYLVENEDVVGVAPTGAAPTTSE